MLNNIFSFFKKMYSVIVQGAKGIDTTKGNIFNKLVIIALPVVLTSLAQNLYEIIDTYFLGRYSETAIASVQVSRNIIWFFNSIGMGLGLGGTTLVAQAKGANNSKEIGKYAGQTIFLLLAISIVVSIIAFIFPKEILRLLGTPESVMENATSYIQIILGPAPIIFYTTAFIVILNGIGNTFITFIFTLFTLVFNAVFDYLLIFGIGIFPEMGVSGAALATIVARLLVAIGGSIYVFMGKAGITIKFKDFIPSFEKIKNVVKIGVPASAGMWGTSFGFMLLMSIVNGVSTKFYNGDPTVINAFGIGNTIIGIYFMVTMGLGQATGIIVGQNIGANKLERAEKSVWDAFWIGLVLCTTGTLAMFFFGEELSTIFIPASKDYSVGVQEVVGNMLRITGLGVIGFGLFGIINGAFQGAGNTIPPMIINISRLWLLRLPLSYFFAFGTVLGINFINPMGANGIWWGMNISNIIVFIIGFYLFVTGKWKKKAIVKQNIDNNNSSGKIKDTNNIDKIDDKVIEYD